MESFLPQLNSELAARIIQYNALMSLLTLIFVLPTWRQYFLSEKWLGYGEDRPEVNVLHNPVLAPVILVVWLGALAGIFFGQAVILSALIHLFFSYYYFIFMRWRGLARGMGAPGFMMYWGAGMTAALALSNPAGRAWPVIVLMLQWDLATIFLSAGISKLTSGYASNHGMDIGLNNPMWSYLPKAFQRLRASHPLYWALNQSAWIFQILGGIMCFVPGLRIYGAAVFVAMFFFVMFQIRLGPLCPAIMGTALIFIPSGHNADTLLLGAFAWMPEFTWHTSPSALTDQVLLYFAIGYLIVRPLVTAGLFYNYLGKGRLPKPLQVSVDFLSNTFGFILWRVFTADVLDFYVKIKAVDVATGSERLISKYEDPMSLRYNQVAEAITVTSLFTTLKYFASNNELFRTRILRYSRTIALGENEILHFEYYRIFKEADRYQTKQIARVIVDRDKGLVIEESLLAGHSMRDNHKYSKISEGIRPGSYLPKNHSA